MLQEIIVGEGQTVPIQTVVGVIASEGAAVAAPAPAASAAPPAAPSAPPAPPAPPAKSPAAPAAAAAQDEAPAQSPEKKSPPAPAAAPQQARTGAASQGNGAEKVRSSPLVRRLAREHNIDVSQLSGTGAGGRVSKQDILGAIESGPAAASTPGAAAPSAPRPAGVMPPPSGGTAAASLETAVPREKMYFGNFQVQPMTVMRQRIAEHMVMSKRVSPHVYSVDEVDVTEIAKLRAKMKEKFEQTTGTKLSFMPFFVRAAIEGLRAFPTVNSSVDGTNIVLHKECNIGIAVALDWGLIVPVVKNAEEKNFLGIARAINDLAERARGKKLKPEEVAESTFTITNPGTFGGLFGLPIISQPNAAILGLGAIEKRPVVIDDAIAIRSMVYLTLSYDHRVVDGAIAHQFMGKVKHTLENWTESVL